MLTFLRCYLILIFYATHKNLILMISCKILCFIMLPTLDSVVPIVVLRMCKGTSSHTDYYFLIRLIYYAFFYPPVIFAFLFILSIYINC